MTAKQDVKSQKNEQHKAEESAASDKSGNQKVQENQESISTEDNTIETLKQQLEALKHKSDQNYELALRAKAELDNVRKRKDQEVLNAHKYALERFVPELLPLLDSLDQGLQTIPQDESFNSIRDGINLTIKMFADVLVKFGVEAFDPTGQPFDPSKHEAISIQKTDEFEPGIVSAVVQKGYVLNDRVLRPARVIVAAAAK